MRMSAQTYTLSATTQQEQAQAIQSVREELAEQGFGVLCEIDVQATLQQKLGEQIEPYVILGACNPWFAHQALMREPTLGTLLPCNVVVYSAGGETHIAAVDAQRMLSIVGNEALEPIAAEIASRLATVVHRAASR
jgi:uncharacterized protein (DUF302 family)